MPRHTENALTDRKIVNAKTSDKQYKLFDGKGLFLLIHPNGSKYFRWDYSFEGKRKTLALGVYPETTLKQAREERLEAQKLLREGKDPIEVRQQLKAKKQDLKRTEQLREKLSFQSVTMEWWERQSGNLTEKHAREIRRSLENHVLSQIGHLQITDITPKAIKDILLGIESEGKAETAHRIHQRVRSVFQYAVMQEWTDRNPAADLHNLLAPVKKEPTSRWA